MPIPKPNTGESKEDFLIRFMADPKMVQEYPDESQRYAIGVQTFEQKDLVYNIPVHGIIGSPEDENDKAKYFTYQDLLIHLNKAQNHGVLNLDIASDGGYVDVCDKMIEAIKKTNKPVTSCNSGNVASAASKLFTLAPKGSRFFHAERGVFLIHNPWGEIEGDSTVLAQAAKELKATENEYAKWYEQATGANMDIILSFMAENIPLTPEQVQELGFAEIVKPTIKAFAKLNNNSKMDNKEVVEKLSTFEKVLNKMMAFFKIKSLMLADANGKELDFPELTDISELKPGAKVMENGSPATGEYTLSDGSILVCEAGQVMEIKQPEPNEMEALKKENEALKAENENLKSEKQTAETQAQEAAKMASDVQAQFKAFKAQFSNYKGLDNKPPDKDEPEVRRPFKVK